ncbi:MAG: DNA repair protein RadC [Alistipes sp.]|nr:DNA repair protein RadC [Alistipes sp.]
MKNVLDKLESRGAAALDNSELLAVLLAESQGDERARSVAQSILAECGGSVSALSDVDFSRLRMMSGIGKLRAARIKAAVELGGRVAQEESAQHDVITSDSDVVRVMRPVVGALQYEECWVLYLASSGRILERMRVSQGGVQATVVDCRLIIKRALELLAVQIVIVHNHPSGSAEPSGQDLALTERVAEAARLFEIRLLDHVIVAQAEHYSFRGHGLIK